MDGFRKMWFVIIGIGVAAWLGFLAGSPSVADDKPTKKSKYLPPVFRSTVHAVGASERFSMVEIPTGPRTITRCVSYSNSDTKASTMSCEWEAVQDSEPEN